MITEECGGTPDDHQLTPNVKAGTTGHVKVCVADKRERVGQPIPLGTGKLRAKIPGNRTIKYHPIWYALAYSNRHAKPMPDKYSDSS